MSAALRDWDGTYLPGDDTEVVADLERFLDEQGDTGFFLVGGAGRVSVPSELAEVIRTAVATFRSHRAVDMTSLPLALTPGQAAPKLRAREDQVEEMLDDGTLPFEQDGEYRRIPLRDLLAYRRRVLDDFHEALASTAFYDDEDVITDDEPGDVKPMRRAGYEEEPGLEGRG